MRRRQEFASLVPRIVRSHSDPVALRDIYTAIERERPDLVDDDLEPGTKVVRWKHELRWEIETLVVEGVLRRRRELGRGMYSVE